ncbi:unnamed protein product [Linum trigynum]|uniref:Uncharacterized protein n=1 Tax=Linum trigynum TaxID=586398 RepID=A0AAV2FGI9_9ROSI
MMSSVGGRSSDGEEDLLGRMLGRRRAACDSEETQRKQRKKKRGKVEERWGRSRDVERFGFLRFFVVGLRVELG